mgnify:CR=1 FL=1|jgi:hypothetical protein
MKKSDIEKVITIVRNNKNIEFFYQLVNFLIDSDFDYLLDVIVDNIDFFELYFRDYYNSWR